MNKDYEMQFLQYHPRDAFYWKKTENFFAIKMVLFFQATWKLCLIHYICSLLRKPAVLRSLLSGRGLTLRDPVLLRIALQINYRVWQSMPTYC